jgi:hypothetical protein
MKNKFVHYDYVCKFTCVVLYTMSSNNCAENVRKTLYKTECTNAPKNRKLYTPWCSRQTSPRR